MKPIHRIAQLAIVSTLACLPLFSQNVPVGDWKLNTSKSKSSAGLPQQQTTHIEPSGDGMKNTTSGTAGDGRPTSYTWTASSAPLRRGHRVRSQFNQPCVPDGQQKNDAPHKMVNVAAVHRNIMERPDVVVDSNRDGPHHNDSGEEADRSQEQPLAPRLGEPVLVNSFEPSPSNDRDERTENRCQHERKKPETAVGPEHL
jgi:hypothetical protein